LADRGGAEIHAYDAEGRETTSVAGDGEPEQKVSAGGLSEPRLQQRAEDDWLHEAKDVAAEIVHLYDRVDARLVVIGGDPKARRYIQDALRSDVDARAHTMEYGRAVDGSRAEREREVGRLVATQAARETVALLERFKEERGQRDLAVDGAKPTMAAIERGQVEVLLVSEGHASNELVRDALRTGATIRVVPESGPIADGVGGLLRWRDAAMR
jgi:peptide subunit release factor 1 (eRF1)